MEQPTLFNLEAFTKSSLPTPAYDPSWDEVETAPEHPQAETRWNPAHFGEVAHIVGDDGQLTIFYDDSLEPPDPDDYLNKQEYEQAWCKWESTVREQNTQVSVELSEDSEKIAGDRRSFVREHDTHTSAPEHSILREPCPPAPEHTHWVEKYWVKRGNSKHNYYRYCWMEGRKIHHCHISGGSITSPLAVQRRAVVETAIADGKLPCEIEKLIRGWKHEPSTMPKM